MKKIFIFLKNLKKIPGLDVPDTYYFCLVKKLK